MYNAFLCILFQYQLLIFQPLTKKLFMFQLINLTFCNAAMSI